MTKAQNLRLELLAALLDSQWNIRYNAHLGFFQASLRGVEVREGTCLLASPSGRGGTAEVAVRDYLGKLSGQLVILHPASPNRREIRLPADMVLAVFGDDS